MDSTNNNAHINPSYLEPVEDDSTEYTLSGRHKVHLVKMREGDTLETQMSVEGAQIIAALSPRITVTFHDVSKVISVPAKMIDPSSKEKFIERTLLDHVSGQIHPGQVVALMGPSGS
jgi:ABC-type multidrug transport system fused ATPase/permease subunit